ncbi:MAG: hypothetical protein K8T26_06545 [Lentisphaerae bacterium]|nr:hypothetical protein [Lentisphaerota bacterium]
MKTNPAEGKILIHASRAHDLDAFEQDARAAKRAGFTHIQIALLSERTDFRGEDQGSPWCEWSVLQCSLFKFATPPGLEDAYPAAFVKRQMAFLKARHAICRKVGLRAAFHGIEPHWLSERVYEKHPQWRGSRCDNSLRTTGMFFMPNVFHPEVLAAYRAAAREITRQCPLIDVFSFHTNDAGAGMPWTKRLYAGPNGPTGYKGKDMGDCVTNFMLAVREGALEAKVDARVFIDCHYWFNDDEAHLIRKSLKPGVGIHGTAPGPLAAEHSLVWTPGWGTGGVNMDPVVDQYPTPMELVQSVATLKTSPSRRFMVWGDGPAFFKAFRVAMDLPAARTEPERCAVLKRIAEDVYAPEVADDVVDAWYTLDRAKLAMQVVGVGTLDAVMLRWLVRPFVAHQEMLTASERAYWEPFLYQSRESQSETHLNYIDLVGAYPVAYDWSDATKISCAIDAVEGLLASAASKLEEAAQKTAVKAAKALLLNDVARIRVTRCIVLSKRHYVQLGVLIKMRDAENALHPKTGAVGGDQPDMPGGTVGSHGLFYMQRVMRWELDNTNELIELLRRAPVPLIVTSKAYEGALVMGPGLLQQLQKKVAVTLKYWRTADVGYYRPTMGG